MLASAVPTARVYDPAFAYESAAIIRDGIRRMHGPEPEDLLYYIALYNENYVMPARPDGLTDEDIVRGLYRFRGGAGAAPGSAAGDHPVGRLDHAAGARGPDHPRRALRRRGGGLERDVVPAAAQRGARGRPLEPAPSRGQAPRVPLVSQLLGEAAGRGPIVAVSDWIRAWPDMISRWVPGDAWRSLGTDGFGAATRARRCGGSSGWTPPHIVAAVLSELARCGQVPVETAQAALGELDVDPEAPFSLTH